LKSPLLTLPLFTSLLYVVETLAPPQAGSAVEKLLVNWMLFFGNWLGVKKTRAMLADSRFLADLMAIVTCQEYSVRVRTTAAVSLKITMKLAKGAWSKQLSEGVREVVREMEFEENDQTIRKICAEVLRQAL
jgi:uncharacterized protein (DUF2147 family)